MIDETVSNMSAYVKPLINSFKNDEELKFKLNGKNQRCGEVTQPVI